MNLWSISFAYRLGLAFHAMNNEGAEGSNLMQPRRIDVGKITYDGISGEIIRRHVLENFVNECRAESPPIALMPLSEGLHPDRGPIGIRAAARDAGHNTLTNEVLFSSVRKAIESCAVLDVGGYLAAWQELQAGRYVAEAAYIDSNCAALPVSNKRIETEVVKRESCFDVAWLISEEPQDLTVTQHSAFRDTFAMNSRYAQTMRSNVYAGVIRADLHRIGTDDYWYLQNGSRLAITEGEQRRRQRALVRAIGNFIASPTAAKVAAWAPHVFEVDGVILLTSSRTAPFASPIRVNLNNAERPVGSDPQYKAAMQALHNGKDTWVWTFGNAKELIESAESAVRTLNGNVSEEAQSEA